MTWHKEGNVGPFQADRHGVWAPRPQSPFCPSDWWELLQAELTVPEPVPPAGCFISVCASSALLLMLAVVSFFLWGCESKICKYICSATFNLYTKLEVVVLNSCLQLASMSPPGWMLSLSAEVA